MVYMSLSVKWLVILTLLNLLASCSQEKKSPFVKAAEAVYRKQEIESFSDRMFSFRLRSGGMLIVNHFEGSQQQVDQSSREVIARERSVHTKKGVIRIQALWFEGENVSLRALWTFSVDNVGGLCALSFGQTPSREPIRGDRNEIEAELESVVISICNSL